MKNVSSRRIASVVGVMICVTRGLGAAEAASPQVPTPANGNAAPDAATSGGSIVTNGDFSHGFEDWHPSIWGDAAGSFTVEKGMAKLAVTNPGTHTYNIMLYEAVALQGDTDYTLEFDIKSDVVSRKFEIVLEHYGEPYNKHLWQKETTSATAGEAKHFTVKFRLPPADLKSKLGFHFGSAAYGQGAVWIGDISIRK